MVLPAVREQYAKMFDGLTGLPGEALLLDRTHVALARAACHGCEVGVVVFDEVRRASSISPDLPTFVSRLRDAFFGDDTVARIGGCTFVVVINDVSDREALATSVHEIVDGSGITCRIGIVFGASPCDPGELIDEALEAAAPPPPPPLPQVSTPWWEGVDGPEGPALATAGS
jgi:GGDEF domain-containing protein